MKKKTERTKRTQEIVQDVHSIDELCAHITTGGTLADWCRGKDIRYAEINDWLQSNDARRKRYESALSMRNTHQRERVIDELRAMLDVDLLDAFDDDGALKPLKEIPLSVRRMISSIEIEELYDPLADVIKDIETGKVKRKAIGRVVKLKLWSKEKGIELMARHQKMLVDKVEHSGKVTLADLLTGETS
jgi:predicted DNA-binding antitoxin AbrB/MazE fold protein